MIATATLASNGPGKTSIPMGLNADADVVVVEV